MSPEPPTETVTGKLLFESKRHSRSFGGLILGAAILWFVSKFLSLVVHDAIAHSTAITFDLIVPVGVGGVFVLLGYSGVAQFIRPRRIEFSVYRRGVWLQDTARRSGAIWLAANEIQSCRVLGRELHFSLCDSPPIRLPLGLIDLSEVSVALRKMTPAVKIPSNAPPGEEEDEEPEPQFCLHCDAPMPSDAARCAKCGWSFHDQPAKREH